MRKSGYTAALLALTFETNHKERVSMKKLLFATLLAFVSFAASAEVAPFGQVIGSATMDSVRAELGQRAELVTSGADEVSGVPWFFATGPGLGIDGLKKARFAFDANHVLVGVAILLQKHRYADLVKALKGKYQLVNEKTPFVGDRSADFREGSVHIWASADHLSHEMTIIYIEDAHYRQYEALRSQQRRAESSREQSQL